MTCFNHNGIVSNHETKKENKTWPIALELPVISGISADLVLEQNFATYLSGIRLREKVRDIFSCPFLLIFPWYLAIWKKWP